MAFTAKDYINETSTSAVSASAKLAKKTAGIALTSLGFVVDMIDLIIKVKKVHEGSISVPK